MPSEEERHAPTSSPLSPSRPPALTAHPLPTSSHDCLPSLPPSSSTLALVPAGPQRPTTSLGTVDNGWLCINDILKIGVRLVMHRHPPDSWGGRDDRGRRERDRDDYHSRSSRSSRRSRSRSRSRSRERGRDRGRNRDRDRDRDEGWDRARDRDRDRRDRGRGRERTRDEGWDREWDRDDWGRDAPPPHRDRDADSWRGSRRRDNREKIYYGDILEGPSKTTTGEGGASCSFLRHSSPTWTLVAKRSNPPTRRPQQIQFNPFPRRRHLCGGLRRRRRRRRRQQQRRCRRLPTALTRGAGTPQGCG